MKCVFSVLLAQCTAFICALLLPSQVSENLTLPNQTPPLNTIHVIYPKDPRGLSVLLQLQPSFPVKAEDIYIAAITCVHDWGSVGWNATVGSSTRTYSKTIHSIVVRIKSAAEPDDEYQLQNKYLIWGWLHLIKAMQDRKTWCLGRVGTTMFKQPVGAMDLGALDQNDASQSSITTSGNITTNANASIVDRYQGRSKSGRIVDPDDPDFVISYQLTGEAMSCVDLFSAILYILATAAQADNDDVCEDLGGVNEMQNVEYQIHGAPRPTVSGYLFTYGLIRVGMRLLAERFYSKSRCGEMKFQFEYSGDVLGSGRIRESDFPYRAVGQVE